MGEAVRPAWGGTLIKELVEKGVVPPLTKSIYIRISHDEFVTMEVDQAIDDSQFALIQVLSGYMVHVPEGT